MRALSWPALAAALLTFTPSACGDAAPRAPGAIDIGRIRLLPSGFLDSVNTIRSATANDSIDTEFGEIPLSDTPSQALTGFQNSRAALLASAPLGGLQVSGYFEVDFWDSAHAVRPRNYWTEFGYKGWRLMAGKNRSLLRANRSGIGTVSGFLVPHLSEPNFHVGLLSGRVRQLRLVRDMGPWQAAVAWEEGGQYVSKIGRDSDRFRLEGVAFAGTRGRRGGGATAIIHVTRRIDAIAQQLWSRRGGPDTRDLTPPGAPSFATLEGIEATVTRNNEIFTYAGLVRGGRSAGNRLVREVTAGFARVLFRQADYASGRLMAEYSFVDRSEWAGGYGRMSSVVVGLRYSVGRR